MSESDKFYPTDKYGSHFEKIKKNKKNRDFSEEDRFGHNDRKNTLKQMSKGFKCGNCHQMIGAASVETVGTAHRDHCPLCLSSKHVDEKPGDRASDCHGIMKPIGFTLKAISDEPMVVYECGKCRKVHKNRLAADDSEVTIVNVLKNSFKITDNPEKTSEDDAVEAIKEKVKKYGIDLVDRQNAEIVLTSIFGRGHIPEEYKKEFGITD